MRLVRRIMTAVAAMLLGLVVCALGVRLYMGRESEDRLAPSEAVRIAELRSPLPEPGFLVCPPRYCSVAEAIASPVFDVSLDRLHEYWTEVIAPEKRIATVAADPDAGRFVYIQHSATLRFPDIITVELVPLGPDRSSIAIYSRSRYGSSDFGKNRKRVERWLVLLEKIAQPARRARGRG